MFNKFGVIMKEKTINIDVEVIKKPKIYNLSYIEASVNESSLQEPIKEESKWQSIKKKFRNKILNRKNNI